MYNYKMKFRDVIRTHDPCRHGVDATITTLIARLSWNRPRQPAMDALTRFRRSLVGDDDEEQPEDSILGDTEDLCSLSPLQVRHPPHPLKIS
jgi:hypothetical protein